MSHVGSQSADVRNDGIAFRLLGGTVGAEIRGGPRISDSSLS